MSEFLSDRFAPGPLFGWLCLAFLGLIPLVWMRHRARGRKPPVRFSSFLLLRSVGTTWATRTRFVVPLLRTLAILCLIVALARPQSGGGYRESREGIAIQMVLDVSGSMAEEDFTINGRPARRLDATKTVFEDFVIGGAKVGGRENDLIGMTTFAMYADTVCPLTLDHGSLIDLLRQTEIPGWVDGRQVRNDPEGGFTSLGDALVLATDDLRRAGEQAVAGVPGAEAAKSRVMILLTDGKDNPPRPRSGPSTAPDPVEAAKVAATLGIKIYTIGAVGTEAAPRSSFPFFLTAPRAEVDEPMLKEIAAATGGNYFRATDVDSLAQIYAEVDRLERRRTGEREFQDDIRGAKFAMLAGLGLLMTELLLVNTRFRRVP
jgi:Ca-activated chloride channel family protein